MAIILYNIKDIRQERVIAEICEDIGCHTRKLTNANLPEKFGRLSGVVYKTPVKGVKDPMEGEKIPFLYNMPECLLFAGFSDEMLDEFLEAYKKAGLPVIGHKAMLTPSNCNWTLYGLLTEIGKEDAAFRKNV